MVSRARSLSMARFLPQGPLDALRQVLLLTAGYLAYRLTRGAVDDPTNVVVAFSHGNDIITLERSLHLFVEPRVQEFAESVPGLTDLASWLYLNAQTTVTLGA